MLKQRLRQLLDERRLDAVSALARTRRRVLGLLVSLTFDADPRIAWRAVEGLGVATAVLAADAPETVRDLLRRLLWLLSEESGGVCWRAPEALAEIVGRSPQAFPDFVPIVVHLIQETAEEDLAHFRPGMLWAIGRLGPLADPHVRDVLPRIVAALDHPDAQVRGVAAWTLGRIGRTDVLIGREDLRDDESPLEWYEDGELTSRSVAGLTSSALRAART